MSQKCEILCKMLKHRKDRKQFKVKWNKLSSMDHWRYIIRLFYKDNTQK